MLGVPVLILAVVVIAIARLNGGGSDEAAAGLPGRAAGTSASGGATSGDAAASQGSLLVRDDSPVRGSPDARVTVVEFLDPECEACRAAYPGIKRLLTEYDGEVRLVVRYFPLHGNSLLAAQATEAAGEQGKYWEMQDLLFENQGQWGEKTTPQTDLFVGYARSLGLDADQFVAALQSGKYAAKVERDQADGRALGVRGTPTIFVNGRLVRDFTYPGLKSAVDAALKS